MRRWGFQSNQHDRKGDTMSKLSKARFWTALVSTVLLLVGDFFRDLNGDYPKIGTTASFMLHASLSVVGLWSALVVAVTDQTRRKAAVVLLTLQVVMFLSVVFW